MTIRTRTTALNVSFDSSSDLLEGHSAMCARDLALATAMNHSRKTRFGRTGAGLHKSDRGALLDEQELQEIEEQFPNGMTAVQIVELFTSRDVRFSESSFRKWVQMGLLPRSRRIGRKGRHRGSLGVYPAKAVRRINLVKSLMQSGYTIEQIQQEFLQFDDVIEGVRDGIGEALALFRDEVNKPHFDDSVRTSIAMEIVEAEKFAEELLTRISGVSERLSQRHGDSYEKTSAAGSAEDLL